MAKKKNISAEKKFNGSSELTTEQERQISELKAQIKEIKTKGKFSFFYQKIRKGAVEINKQIELSDIEKKSELVELCKTVQEEIEELED